jgi:hypothetical protein
MIIIRTAEEMARALDSPLHPEMKQLLQNHWAHLSEYEGYSLEELALFIITEPTDTLADIEAACSRRLVQVGVGQQLSSSRLLTLPNFGIDDFNSLVPTCFFAFDRSLLLHPFKLDLLFRVTRFGVWLNRLLPERLILITHTYLRFAP